MYPPQITALALTTTDERFSGDVRVLTKLLDKEHAAHTALGDAATLLDLHDVDREEAAIIRALADGLDLDAVVPDPSELTPAVSGLAVLDFLNAQVQTAPPVVPEWDERGLFATEVDFLREALHEAFAEPGALPDRGGVGWREHPAEGVVELVPPADLMTRLGTLPQSYLAERRVRDRLLLATTRPAADDSLRLARAGDDTQWPAAHYLSPLHPVLDWAVDRALAQLGRNHVPVATADVDVPTAITLGTLSNQRGQVVLRSIIAQAFPSASVTPFVFEEVAGLLEDCGFTKGGVNTGATLDLTPHQGLVSAAVKQMHTYMDALRATRLEALSQPIEQARQRIAAWSQQAEALADNRAAAQAARTRREIARHRAAATELADSLTARPDPMIRVLLLLLPRHEGQ